MNDKIHNWINTGLVALVLVVVLALALVGNQNQPGTNIIREITGNNAGGEDLAGKTRLPEVNVSWIELGSKVSSSTDSVYGFTASFQISGTEAEDAFLNTQIDLNGVALDLLITKVSVYTSNTASSSTRLFGLASTSPTAVATVSTAGDETPYQCAIIKQLYATSTTDLYHIITATTTVAGDNTGTCGNQFGKEGTWLLRYGRAMRFVLVPGDGGVDDVDTQRDNYAESASSTALGIKPVTIFIEGYATTSPMIPREDTR